MSNTYTYAHRFRAHRALLPLGLAAPLLLAACHPSTPPDPPPVNVVALPVHAATTPDAYATARYPVEAAARDSTVMSFRVAGQVVERKMRLGDAVRRGDVLARLDSIDAERQVAAASAALTAAEHRLAFATQQLERDRAQQAQNLIATSQIEQSEDSHAAALAAREQAKSQSVMAGNALRYHTLVAEHDGVITSENADTGQVVAAGQAVYGLAWSGDIDVTMDAAASDLAHITRGQSADVTFFALPGRRFTAHVRDIAPDADPQSRTWRIKLTLADRPADVRLGMTGEAALSTATFRTPATGATVFEIPATALFHQGKDPAVWIVTTGKSTLALQPVTVLRYAERSVIVSGGLKEGDTVVVAGVHTVFDGQHVTPVKPLFAEDAALPAVASAPSP